MIPSGIEPATFRFVGQHLNHCATTGDHGRRVKRDNYMNLVELGDDRSYCKKEKVTALTRKLTKNSATRKNEMSGAKRLFLKQIALKQTDNSLPHSFVCYRVISLFVRRNPHLQNTLSYRQTPLIFCSVCTTCFGRAETLSRDFNIFTFL